MPDLIPIEAVASLANLAWTIERAKEYGRNAKSAATRRAYAADVADFERFCRGHGLEWLPAAPTTLGLYLAMLAETGRSVSTIRRRVAAIADQHGSADLPNPAAAKPVKAILAGIARERGVAPTRKAALTIDLVRAVLRATAVDLHGLRDRAVILLGFHAAMRRSELAALDVQDLSFQPEGIVVTIRRSKTDQDAAGYEIGVPSHPDATIDAVAAVRGYLDAAGISSGAVFRTFSLAGALQANRIDGRDVARIVQRAAKGARLGGDMAGHSLRAGFVTSAAKANVGIDRIAAVSRHKSPAILLGYVRRARVFEDSPQLAIT